MMKRVLLASAGLLVLGLAGQSASAADIPRRAPAPVKAPAVVPVPYYNWTGFYVGGHAGYGSSDKDWSDAITGPFTTSHKADGFLGGGQIGFNYQTGSFVFGVEGEFSWTDLNGNSASTRFGGESFDSRIDWLAAVTGRLGFAANNWLFYAKGGVAFVDDKYTYRRPGLAAGVPVEVGDTRTGWTVGAGVEYAFWNNWSAKLEYQYYDFGGERLAFSPVDRFDIDQQVHAVKLGVNYRFGFPGAPVVARH